MMPSTTPPRTPFSTPLSGSAKEARLRLLHILQGPKKGPPAPLAALLFTDFFLVRRQRVDLRSAFGLPGYQAYHYTGGFNWVGLACVAAGVALSLAVYDPVSGTVRCPALFTLTPTGLSFLGTGVFYVVLSRIPPIRRYLLRDRKEVTV